MIKYLYVLLSEPFLNYYALPFEVFEHSDVTNHAYYNNNGLNYTITVEWIVHKATLLSGVDNNKSAAIII